MTSSAEKQSCPHSPGQGKPVSLLSVSPTFQELAEFDEDLQAQSPRTLGTLETFSSLPASILLGISSSLKPSHLRPENPRSPLWSRSFTSSTLNDKCPYKKRRRDHGKPHEDRGRDWGHAATNQETWGHQKLERQGRKSPLEP